MESLKRKHPDDSSAAIYSNKSRTRAPVEARVDPTYGQRSAIPGLDDETIPIGDEDFNYDDGLDAIAYLKAVRQEATSIPNLLVAPKTHSTHDRDVYNDGVGDFRGWYEDGAYLASNGPLQSASIEDEDSASTPQFLYHDSILLQYETLRTKLQQTPPPELVTLLDKAHPIHVGRLTSKLAKWWIWHMRNTPPLPVQVASMDKTTVLRLLGLMSQGTALKRGLKVEINLSRWLWSLLARLPDRGALTSEEIGVVRDLGKKAVLVGAALKERKDWEQGILQVEAAMDGERDLDEEEEVSDVVNEDEIDVAKEINVRHEEEMAFENGAEDELDRDSVSEGILGGPNTLLQQCADTLTQEGDSNRAPKLNGTHITNDTNILPQEENGGSNGHISVESLVQEGLPYPTSSQEASEDIEALKARLLKRLENNDLVVDINLEPEILPAPPIKESEDISEREMSPNWNTQATVDIILTIASEAYGQRDLLEFRGDWGDVVN